MKSWLNKNLWIKSTHQWVTFVTYQILVCNPCQFFLIHKSYVLYKFRLNARAEFNVFSFFFEIVTWRSLYPYDHRNIIMYIYIEIRWVRKTKKFVCSFFLFICDIFHGKKVSISFESSPILKLVSNSPRIICVSFCINFL